MSRSSSRSSSASASASAGGNAGPVRQWYELNAHVKVCLGDKGPRFGVIEPPTFTPFASNSSSASPPPPPPPPAAAAAAAAAQPHLPPPPLPRLDAASTRLLAPAADAYLALRRHEEEGAVRGDKARAIAGMLASSAEHYAQRTAALEARVAAEEEKGGGGGGGSAREELQRHVARSAERDDAERMLAQEARAHDARSRTLRAQLKTRLRETRDKVAQRERPLELSAAPQPPPQQQQPRGRRRSTLSKLTTPAHRRRTSSAASATQQQKQQRARRRSSAAPASAKSSFRRPTTASAAPPLLPPAAAAPAAAVVIHAPAAAALPPPVPLTSVYLRQHTRSPSLGDPLPPCDGTVAPYGGPAEALAAAARVEGGSSSDGGGSSRGSGGGGGDFVSEASSDEAGVFGGLFLNMKYLWPEKVSSYRTRPPPEEEDSVDHFSRPVLGCTPCFRRPRYANPRMPFYRYLIAAPPSASAPQATAPLAARPPLLDRRPSDAILGRVSERWKTRRRAEAQAEAEAEAKVPPAPSSPKQGQIEAAAATVAPQPPQAPPLPLPAPAAAPAPTLMAALQQRRRKPPATRGQLCRGSACLAPRVVPEGAAAAAATATAAPLSPAALVVGTAADLVDTSAPWYVARQPGPTIALAL